ncbi:MAG: hypothetical protein IID31_06160 [Planctomycetes bacterium]|nr:hypothetical protein [Planctomycetota bacterium]
MLNHHLIIGGAEVPPSADEGTLVEVLEVAADAYAAAICDVFRLRNIFHPGPTPNVCQESAGWSCYGDCDSNGVLDIFDFLCFQNAFVAGDPYADCDRDGQWTLFDFVCFQSEFVGGCP